MTKKNDSLLPDEAWGLSGDEYREDELTGVEKTFQALLQSGVLASPQEKDTEPTEDNLSELAQQIGNRVRTRILDRLGLSTLGAYIKAEREQKRFRKKQVSAQAKLSASVLAELEQGSLSMVDLTVKKAVDIVEAIGLNVQVVVSYLRAETIQTPPSGEATIFYRRELDLSSKASQPEEKKNFSAAKQPKENGKQQIEKFIEDFEKEARRRGLV